MNQLWSFLLEDLNKRKIMMKIITSVMFTICIICFVLPISAQNKNTTPTNNPVELGKVNWLRDYDKAVAASQESDKPIFILFQEVPGCSTCSKFGFGPLSDPFLVEAIEDNFIPLAIYNNKKGADADILKKFNEPAWNNPVVRIVNANGRDISPRMANRWSPEDLLSTIKSGLVKSKQEVPAYLDLRLQEVQGQENLKEANLAMFCFWTGEKEISKIDGVLSTEAGFMHGKEVVRISYDANQVTLPTIVNQAAKVRCADAVFVEDDYDLADLRRATKINQIKRSGDYHKDKEVKYYLTKSDYKYIPMTQLQQAKVNAAIGSKQNPDQYLSPRQLLAHKYLVADKSRQTSSQINREMKVAWYGLWDEVVFDSK